MVASETESAMETLWAPGKVPPAGAMFGVAVRTRYCAVTTGLRAQPGMVS